MRQYIACFRTDIVHCLLSSCLLALRVLDPSYRPRCPSHGPPADSETQAQVQSHVPSRPARPAESPYSKSGNENRTQITVTSILGQ